MKKFTIAVLGVLILSCSADDEGRRRNPFLLDLNFNFSLNTNLPQYSDLQFPSNSVYLPNLGNRGVIVINTGSGFLAWDASDPNHVPNTCSTLTINGIEATCGCEEANRYNLVTGQAVSDGSLQYPLLQYRATQNGNIITISN
ncbi:hypothetical protein [Croceiramulus getboli]|nr:hypothetical protein P8624_06235 [Flavobacteriaceae bacterium YJPT1-3]